MTVTNVLIVEDEVIVAMDLKLELEDRGYAVVGSALKVSQAFQYLRECEFDVVLCDVSLNDELSYDFARACRENDIEVIFMSGYSETEFPRDLADARIHRKPVAMDDLVCELEAIQATRNRLCA